MTACPTCSLDFVQQEALINTRVWKCGLSNPSELDAQTPSPQTELFPHLTTSRFYGFYLTVFFCLGFMFIALYMFIVPLRSPKNPQQKIIKRVIGLEGDFIR